MFFRNISRTTFSIDFKFGIQLPCNKTQLITCPEMTYWEHLINYSWFLSNFTWILGMFRSVTPEQEFCRTCGFRRIVPDVILHDFKVFREKINDEIFLEIRKTIEKWHRFCLYSKAICRVKGRKYQKTNRTRNIIRTLVFMKIESDFDLDRPLRRYSCFKRGTKFGTFATFPNIRRTGIFPNMGFSPKCAHYHPSWF